jgi:outer membrane protein OmpA-like peptidoglycan-associated protein
MFASRIVAFLSFSLVAANCFSQDQQKLTVHFDFNQSALTPKAKALLNRELKTGTRSSPLSVDITGFCDNTGSNGYNDSLSEKRAEAVKAYLLENGLSSTVTINISGKGEAVPLNENRDEKERALNRRVELILFKETPVAVTTKTTTVIASPTPTPATAPSIPVSDLARQMTSDSLKEGSGIILQNMNFHGGAHVLLPESYPVLKELIAVLKAYPKIKIEIQGHVCCTKLPDGFDNDLGTYDLSVQRAKTIYQYLVVNGVEASRLAYKGFGSSQRLYPDELNEKEQALNRRVEIKITAK